VVRDEIVECESVVTGHEVDALLGLPLLVAVDIGTAEQPIGERPDRALVAPEETADVASKPSVPFPPAVADERPDLVKATGIPRLGDELRPRQRRVRVDVPQDRSVRT